MEGVSETIQGVQISYDPSTHDIADVVGCALELDGRFRASGNFEGFIRAVETAPPPTLAAFSGDQEGALAYLVLAPNETASSLTLGGNIEDAFGLLYEGAFPESGVTTFGAGTELMRRWGITPGHPLFTMFEEEFSEVLSQDSGKYTMALTEFFLEYLDLFRNQ